jgi:hypothetical protein
MRHKKFILGIVLAASLLIAWTINPAEVRGGRVGDVVYVLVLQVIEGGDPVQGISWEPVSGTETGKGKPLNPSGDARGDGRPDVAIDPSTGWPLVTWSYWAGTDYDIAWAEWVGEDWSEIGFITSTIEDQLEPRSHIDVDGTIRTVWWEDLQSGKLYLAIREPGETVWGVPELIQHSGRRPSIVPDSGSLLVAFEEDGPQGTQKVSVVTLLGESVAADETLSTTDREDPLDVAIHESGGTFWAEWKHSDDYFAYSVRGTEGWGDPVLVPWTDHTWTGEEELRLIIRSEVLTP